MANYIFANNSVTGEEIEDIGITESTRYVFLCFMVLIAVIGITGNTVVVTVLIKLRERSSTDYFVLAISGIDLFSSTVNTSCYILRYESNIWKIFASDIFCRLHVFSIGWTNTCSTLLLAATAIDRLRRTRSMATRIQQNAVRKAKRIAIGIVILGFAYSVGFFLTRTLDSTTLSCIRTDGHETAANIFDGILALIYTCLLIVVVVCYTRIVRILRNHHRNTRNMKLNTISRDADRRTSPCPQKSRIGPCYDNMPSTSRGISTWQFEIEGQRSVPQQELPRMHVPNMHVSAASRELKNESADTSLMWRDTKTKEQNLTVFCVNNIVNIDAQTPRKSDILKNPQPSYSVNVLRSIERDRNDLNRTTLMLFLITWIYISTWIVNWMAFIYGAVTDSRTSGPVFLFAKIFMINCSISPVFYIIMSSKFKQQAKKLLCKM